MMSSIRNFWFLLLSLRRRSFDRVVMNTLAALLLIFVSTSSAHARIKIEVIYPKEGSQVIAAESTFIYGNVTPAEAVFQVNNVPTRVFPNGAFIAYVPVKPGRFSFVCQAATRGDTAAVVRNVYIPYYLKTSRRDSLVIDTSYVFPREDWELQPGNVFKVAVKGTPGCRATFSIDGLAQNLPMTEIPPRRFFYWGEAIFGQGTNLQMADVRGIYTGVYVIQTWDWAVNREIRFRLRDKSGNVLTTTAPGRLSIDNSTIPRIAKITGDMTIAQTGPRLGSQLFLSQGAMVWITGRRGNHLRVRLSEIEEIWIRDENNLFLPPGTPLPEGNVTAIRTEGLDNKTRVKILIDQRLPFKVEQVNSPPALWVTLYGVIENTDQVQLDFNEPMVREIRWEQKARNVYQVQIELNQAQHWGYHPYYQNRDFYIDIKKKPGIHSWPGSSLKNRIICLDPGHGPDLGAIGPSGATEKDMNYKYCVALKRELEKKGAFVVLTRGKNDGATLKARTQIAAFMEADILLSIHFNGLPDGVDPTETHGISTYYYQPQGYRLASLIQKKLLSRTGLKSFGLFYDNLAICRTTQMISVLVEPGFIIHPWEEILIASGAYREKVVAAIAEAIEQFFKESK